ncbi:NADH-quinone oxidoreductase subunit E [Ewingella americana]|uniref:NADH-quinone oxidoreductase subunit E n=1 Tax=Ewingella americana TaxID=41202 RepID=A0A377NAR2_9GAMM|nr:NADH-quinone oxidoreductase subunit E [Ewingella americana]
MTDINKDSEVQYINVSEPSAKPAAFELNDAEREAIEHEKHHYEDARAVSIEALKIVQKHRGWVPDGAIYAIAEILDIPASDVEGVQRFIAKSSASRWSPCDSLL